MQKHLLHAAALLLLVLPAASAPASTILIDLGSGRTILEENPDAAQNAAAMAPLMAVYTALDLMRGNESRLTAEAPNPWAANRPDAPKTVDAAAILEAALMNGSPEAVAALPGLVSLTPEAFALRMNAAAARLGMTSAHFSHPCGAAAPCIASARDVARLAQALYDDFPLARIWGAEQTMEVPGLPSMRTSNPLLERSPAITGVYFSPDEAPASGAALSENPTSAGQRIRRLLAVELNAADRRTLRERLASLFLRAYRDYETLEVYKEGAQAARLPVFKGAAGEVGAVVDSALYATLPRERMIAEGAGAFVIRVSYASPLIAPIFKGERVGTLHVLVDGSEVASAPLSAAEDVPEGGFWTRFIDTLRIALEADAPQN